MIRTYSVVELETLSGVARRTISDYVSKGLLAGPSHRGRGARYPQSDLHALQLLPRLRTLMHSEFPNLKSIADFMGKVSSHDLQRLSRNTSPESLEFSVRRLRVKQSLMAMLPTVAPETIESLLEELTRDQVIGIDTGRYPIGALLDLQALGEDPTDIADDGYVAEEDSNLADTGRYRRQATANWVLSGHETVDAQRFHKPDDVRSEAAELAKELSGIAHHDDEGISDRLTEFAERIERIERLLAVK